MTLRDFDQLADKSNILKFNMDAKLSKYLNRILVMRKDDPFFSHRYNVYMRHKLHKNIERGLQNKTLLSGDETPTKYNGERGDEVIDKKIAALRFEVHELMQ
jgi:hypothetical protein